jgi:hypothetical protein
VHKISTYIHIYENRKRKREINSRLAEPEGKFWPSAGAGARRHGRMGPDGPQGGETAQADAVSAGPCVRERGSADGVGQSDGGGGANRPGLTADEVPRRFSAVAPVPGGRGGLARAGVGGQGGGVNLAGGRPRCPVHDKVAGSLGGEVADKATG